MSAVSGMVGQTAIGRLGPSPPTSWRHIRAPSKRPGFRPPHQSLEVPLRVLVTGHNGYIGSVLVPMVQEAGHDVVGLDIDLFASCVMGDAPPEIESICKDVRAVESDDFVGFDGVIHLAAVCNDPVGDLNPQATYAINHLGSVRVAEMAKAAGRGPVRVRVVLQSLRQGG